MATLFKIIYTSSQNYNLVLLYKTWLQSAHYFTLWSHTEFHSHYTYCR